MKCAVYMGNPISYDAEFETLTYGVILRPVVVLIVCNLHAINHSCHTTHHQLAVNCCEIQNRKIMITQLGL